MTQATDRRTALLAFGGAITVGASGLLATQSQAATETTHLSLPPEAGALAELTKRLAAIPRRRDFKSVPMILNSPEQWDHEALSEVLAYKPAAKQVCHNTDIGGFWLGVMRNTLNGQTWSFRHPDFLVVSATHGTALLALYDQAMWDKYGLAKLAGNGFEKNTLIVDRPAASADAASYEDPHGVFSGENNSIPALQRRGVVFMACHNAIWELADKLHGIGVNPDKTTVDVIAADLTNHLIPDAVLMPGAASTVPELQQAGFLYVRL
jgi:intracellular sulfur oxidation DsrE/DsrF family protein